MVISLPPYCSPKMYTRTLLSNTRNDLYQNYKSDEIKDAVGEHVARINEMRNSTKIGRKTERENIYSKT
jgi:hypothetical protein